MCGPASPQFLCGGIAVEFDQPLVLDRTLGQGNAWVASGRRPVRKLFREGPQNEYCTYARWKSVAEAASASRCGVTMKLAP